MSVEQVIRIAKRNQWILRRILLWNSFFRNALTHLPNPGTFLVNDLQRNKATKSGYCFIEYPIFLSVNALTGFAHSCIYVVSV